MLTDEAAIDFWRLPESTRRAMRFYLMHGLVHIGWQYTKRERFMRPGQIAALREFSPQKLGKQWQMMCSRWAVDSAQPVQYARAMHLIENGQKLCPYCRMRLGDRILDTSIEWMIGRGRWTPGDSVGFVLIETKAEP